MFKITVFSSVCRMCAEKNWPHE